MAGRLRDLARLPHGSCLLRASKFTLDGARRVYEHHSAARRWHRYLASANRRNSGRFRVEVIARNVGRADRNGTTRQLVLYL